MAFVVEDGTGLETATSYTSVAEADAYAVDTGVDDWDSFSDEEKQIALNNATNYIDNTYRTRWIGTRKTRDQSLSWVRYNAMDSDGWILPSDKIPPRLKNAVTEIAFIYADNPDIDLYAADPALANVKVNETSEKVDVIETSEKVEYFGNNDISIVEQTRARFAQSKIWLSGLVGSSIVGRVDRA